MSSRLLVATSLVLLLTACGGGGGTDTLPSVPGTGGTLRVAVTDDPFPVDFVLEASVEIGQVEAHDQDTDGWVVLSTEMTTINLVGLTSGVVETLIDIDVAPGTYDQFRFLTGPGRVVLDADQAVVTDPARLQTGLTIETPDGPVVADGYVFTVADGGVKFPSGPQTGIKVHVDPPIVVTTALSGDLLLDFDLGRNFVFNGPVAHAPGVKRVLFTPSVRASNDSVNGSATVVVLADEGVLGDPSDDSPLAGAEVWLLDATDAKVASSFTDVDGMAVLTAPAGTYTLGADKFGFVEGTLTDVTITLANLSDAGPITLTPSEITLGGTVYSDLGTPADTDDDEVLEGVVVTLQLFDDTTVVYEDQATTDAAGSFTFERLEAGTYALTFTADGFAEQTADWATSGGAMDVRMPALTQVVTATVLDATPSGVAEAVVTATHTGGITWTATTDANGDASFTLPSGTYTFTATDATTTTWSAAAPLDVVGDTDSGTSDSVNLTPDA